MWRIFGIVLIMLGGLAGTAPAQARRGIPLVYNAGHTRVELVAPLPTDPEFEAPTGHVDLGWAYADYSLFGIPFGYGGAEGYVLFNDGGYYQIDTTTYGKLAAAIGRDPSAHHVLSPLGHLWGWLLLAAGGALLALWRRFRAFALGDDDAPSDLRSTPEFQSPPSRPAMAEIGQPEPPTFGRRRHPFRQG